MNDDGLALVFYGMLILSGVITLAMVRILTRK